MTKLRDAGYLEKEGNKPRAIDATKREEIIKIPVVGIIAAGQPIEAIEIPNATIAISKKEIIPTEKHYALRVQGESMVNEGIFDGDIVVIRKQSTADNGQTVVAIIDDNEATLKKFYREKGRFRLQPANQTMLPFYRKEVEVRGIVVKIVRNLENGVTSHNELVKHIIKKNKKNYTLSEFGKRIIAAESKIAEDRFNETQFEMLSEFVKETPFYSQITFSIMSVVDTIFILSKAGYPVNYKTFQDFFVRSLGKHKTWKQPQAQLTGTYHFANYAEELGFIQRIRNDLFLTPKGIQAILIFQLNRSIKLINSRR